MSRLTRTAVAALAAATVTGAATANAHAAISDPPRSVDQGRAFSVAHVPDGKDVHYFLSADARHDLADLRLIGPLSGKGATRLMVPSARPGAYRLLACRPGHCDVAAKKVTVTSRPTTDLRAFADAGSNVPKADASLAAAHGYRADMCPKRSAAATPRYETAIKRAEELAERGVDPKALAAFRASSVHRSADRAEAAALEAIAAKRPRAALAALLRAIERAPSEPRHLVSAAGLLAMLGAPADALALLRRADELDIGPSQPFGINLQALSLNARGAALVALGRFAEATPVLRAATQIDPLLSEARLNLSIALLCSSQSAQGLLALRAGLLRQPTIGDTGVSAPAADQQFDLTHGTTATLPAIPVPGNYQQAAASVEFYRALNDARQARFRANIARQNVLNQQWLKGPANLLTRQRLLDVISLSTPDSGNPTPPYGRLPAPIKAMDDQILKQSRDAHTLLVGIATKLVKDRADWTNQARLPCASLAGKDAAAYQACTTREYNARCPAGMTQYHQQVVDAVGGLETATRQWAAESYGYRTGVLANIADAGEHERWSLMVDDAVDAHWAAPLELLQMWGQDARDAHCGEPADPGLTAPPAPATPHSEACPKAIRAAKLSWKIGADKAAGIPFGLAIDVNCEKVSVEASGDIAGWIGAFAQLDYSVHSGKVSVFAGPKANAKIPGTSLGASFKDGLYVRFGADGNVDDFGFRTATGASGGFGPFSIKGSGESMDFSFAPVFGLR